VAAGDLVRGGAHTLRHKALQLGLYGAVIRVHDIRTGLRLPGNTVKLLYEQVRGGREVSCPDDFLLLLRQVVCEALDAVGQHPHSPIRDFEVGENVGDGEFRLLPLRCLVRVQGECGDVDQPGDPIISSRSRPGARAPWRSAHVRIRRRPQLAPVVCLSGTIEIAREVKHIPSLFSSIWEKFRVLRMDGSSSYVEWSEGGANSPP
jgi:hypothetical protein